MDKETFDKVARLVKQIKELENTEDNIRYCHLNFVNAANYKCKLILPTQIWPIKDILDKHEDEIRKEIDDKIKELKKQIEKL